MTPAPRYSAPLMNAGDIEVGQRYTFTFVSREMTGTVIRNRGGWVMLRTRNGSTYSIPVKDVIRLAGR